MGTLEASRKVEYVKIIKDGPSKKAEMIYTGLTFIISTLLIVFAIVPTIQTVMNINSEIKEKKQITVALKNKLEALTSLDGQYKANETAFKDLTLIYPTSKNFSLLLANIEAIVTRNSFLLDSISFSEYKQGEYTLKTKALIPYSVRLSVSGQKIYIINLLEDLEDMPMFPVIEGISYSTDVDKEGNTTYSLQMRVYQIENINFYD